MSEKRFELYNEDCLEVLPKLAEQGIKVDMVLTDIPYGTTKCKWDTIIPLNEMWDCLNNITYETTPILLFCDEPFSSSLRLSNINDWKYDWLWIKEGASNIFNAKSRPLKYHENICVFYKKQPKYYPDRIMIPRISRRVEEGQRTGWVGKSKTSEVTGKPKNGFICDVSTYDKDWKNPSQHIYFSRVKGNSHEKTDHPTQKPVKLLEHLIKAYTDETDLILDFTMGSGSTGVACANLNRDFIGIELEPRYYKIAEQRIKEANEQRRLI